MRVCRCPPGSWANLPLAEQVASLVLASVPPLTVAGIGQSWGFSSLLL